MSISRSAAAILASGPDAALIASLGLSKDTDINTVRKLAQQTGFQRALTNAYTMYYTQRFQENPDELAQLDPKLAEFMKNIPPLAPAMECKYAHVTLNFPPVQEDVSMLTYAHKVISILQKQPAFVKRWVAVFEHFTAKGQHPHIHMLIEKTDENMDKSPAQIAQAYARKFTKYTGIQQHAVHVRKLQDTTQVLSYIMGTKSDPDKVANVEKDHAWRELYEIPHVLGHWEAPAADPVLVNALSSTETE